MQIAVLGAGSTALANAWFLARAGHAVRLWSALEAVRRALASIGRRTAHGIVNDTANVTIAPSPKACLDGALLVIIAAPTFAHQPLLAGAAPHLTAQQVVMVHPVTGLSSPLLCRMLKDRAVKPTIVDVPTSLFTARKTDAAAVDILGLKTIVDVATIPGDRRAHALRRREDIFGKRFRGETSRLGVSLPGGPQEFEHRCITEDVPYGLIFFRPLGQLTGVKMPIGEAPIRLASGRYARDFTDEGHTVARLGLAASSGRDIPAISSNGF